MFKIKQLLSVLTFLYLTNYQAFSEDPGCEIVSFITHCEIRNNKLTQVDSVVIQVNNRLGERFTDISIPYSKNCKITDLKAWIEDGFGNVVRKLKNNEITDKSSISDYSLYEDDFIKTFTLKHNEYPYRVIYTYQASYKQFISIPWYPVVYYKVPTRKAKFTLLAPKDFTFQQYNNNVSESGVAENGDLKRYSWQASYLKPINNEMFAPSKDEVLPCLYIVPNSFVYGVEGSSKDWRTFGNWLYRLIQGLDDLPDQEKTTVSQLVKGISDKKEIIKILYHYMQDHTRYINVSINIGGLKPYPASYVATNKYGDCKALTNYLKALLKTAGIQSYYTVIYGGEQPSKIVEQVPGPQYFNHIILTVPLGKDTIWLENTSNICPFGYVGNFTQNRKALLIDENDSRLICIPSLKRNDVLVSRKIEVDFNRMGDAAVNILATMRGEEFDWFNGFNSQINDIQKDEEMRKNLTYSNFDLVKWTLQKKDRDTREFKLELNLTFYKYLKYIDRDSYLSLVPIDFPAFESPKERKLPLKISYPVYKIDTLEVKTPPGFEIKSKPADVKVSTIFGNYGLSFYQLENAMRVIRSFEIYPESYSLGQYADFYKFIASAKEADKTKIVFRKKE